MRTGRHGFSMIELVMAVAIIAASAAIALPRYVSSVQHYQVDLAARQIVNDLGAAQSRANYSSTPVTMTFNTGAGTYQIVGMPDLNSTSANYTVNLAKAPYQVQLTSVNFGGASQIVFDGYGTPQQGGTIVITLGIEQHTITVDATSGKATIQ